MVTPPPFGALPYTTFAGTMAISVGVPEDVTTLIQSWLRSSAVKKKGQLPQSYPEITPRPDRCGLGAESIHKSTDHSTRSLVAKKLQKSLKSEKRYCSLSSTHDEEKQEEEEGGKVAVLSKAVRHKHARATLADLRKKKRKRKRTLQTNLPTAACINGLDRSNVKNVTVTDELSTSVGSSQSLVETAGHSSDDVDTQPHTTTAAVSKHALKRRKRKTSLMKKVFRKH